MTMIGRNPDRNEPDIPPEETDTEDGPDLDEQIQERDEEEDDDRRREEEEEQKRRDDDD
jgi:hypothetical protein